MLYCCITRYIFTEEMINLFFIIHSHQDVRKTFKNSFVAILSHKCVVHYLKIFVTGILMIRKEGNWGKLCTQNFEALSSIFKSRWTLEDLGKVVCKTMTFR